MGGIVKWNRIEFFPPPEGLELLVYIQKFGVRSGYMDVLFFDEGEWYSLDDNKFIDTIDYFIPTHWMSLPNRPI